MKSNDSETDTKRLSKVLSAAGVASRRACEELIFAGRVQVNGKTVYKPQYQVDTDRDRISVDGETVGKAEHKVYYLLNKPAGYLCTARRPGLKHRLVLDLIPKKERIFTVGRLDRDTEGLIILTNDGVFAHEVMHPSSEIAREYVVKTDRELSHEDLKTISSGTWVDGAFVKPESVKKVRKGTLKIVVKEGRKHEVRLLVAAAGLEVRSLTRVRFGGLMLGKLPVGTYRVLDEKDREAIFA